MSSAKFGELLGRLVELDGHDIEEILDEQAVSHRRFGEIALSWGLCQPEHIWHAWITQLSEQAMRIDLDDFGVDCQALAYIPCELAMELNIIPVRILGDQLVVAASDMRTTLESCDLPERFRQNILFVQADAGQIRDAIESYYGVLAVAG